MSGPLLVVAHEATRTGSPRVLLELLRYAVPRIDVPVVVRALTAGPLLEDLEQVATAGDHGASPRAIFANSASAAVTLTEYDPTIPSAVYVHEEGDALAALGDAAVLGLTAIADRVLCVSERSRRDLVTLGVRPEVVVVVPPVVVVSPPAPAAIARASITMGAVAGEALVVGCGEGTWRKGTDLFVQFGAGLAADRPVRLAWIGRCARSFGRILDHDVTRLGLAERMTWVDEVADVAPYLAAADIVVCVSREDPQPLVPLEAAVAGTPSVGLAIGGMAEFADAGALVAVEFPDLGALAEQAQRVLDDVDLAERLVGEGRRIVEAERSIEVVGNVVVAELRALTARRSSTGTAS